MLHQSYNYFTLHNNILYVCDALHVYNLSLHKETEMSFFFVKTKAGDQLLNLIANFTEKIKSLLMMKTGIAV